MQVNFGKLFIVGFDDFELDQATSIKLKAIDPAGVILYDCNIKQKDQVKKLIKDLKALLGEDLIVSVDQEGGKVERLRKVASSLPSMQALGQASLLPDKNDFDPQLFIDYSTTLASSLHELGFNMVFAPCVDLATNPLNPIIGTRSLGSNEDLVSRQAKLIIKILQEANIIACAKHFPGHGDTSKDSHLELPYIEFNPEVYFKHLKPFEAAILAGVKTIMIAHLLIKNNSPDQSYKFDDVPTSLSKRLIQEHLRTELGFKGVVVSDEITMKALSLYGDYSEISYKMIQAGNNLIIWNSNLDDALKSAQYLNSNCDEDLIKNYNESLSYIKNLKITNDFQEPILINKDQKMVDICRRALRNPLNIKLPPHPDIYIFNHPKLELEIFQEIFTQSSNFIQYSNSLDLETLQSNPNPVLLFSFQLANYPELLSTLETLKNIKKNLIIISVDQEDSLADIHLYGPNRAHLEALRDLF
jgi:beta-glucosidase-like glycosyl hydrolase